MMHPILTPVTVYIALGSNQGQRRQYLGDAVHQLQAHIEVEGVSPLYETEPAYVLDQPRFLNAVVRGQTSVAPLELLRALKTIERDLGRTAGTRYGPRPIDLDILLYGEQQIDLPSLTVPHPRMHERPFVLVPLADLAADLVPPGWTMTVGELARQVRRTGDILAQVGTLEL